MFGSRAESTRARARRRGMTLVELVVVLVVLAAIAGLALTSVGTVAEDAREQTTRLSLSNLRNAIDGPYRLHLGGIPQSVADLLRAPTGAPAYDPSSKTGWNGPYVRVPIARYVVGPILTPGAEGFVDASFTLHYGSSGDLAVLDGYGRPIVLQVPDPDADDDYSAEERRHARLVSAGFDGVVDTPRNALYPSLALCDDDLVLYLVVADTRPE